MLLGQEPSVKSWGGEEAIGLGGGRENSRDLTRESEQWEEGWQRPNVAQDGVIELRVRKGFAESSSVRRTGCRLDWHWEGRGPGEKKAPLTPYVSGHRCGKAHVNHPMRRGVGWELQRSSPPWDGICERPVIIVLLRYRANCYAHAILLGHVGPVSQCGDRLPTTTVRRAGLRLEKLRGHAAASKCRPRS
jgi:hypothetical protein